MGSHLMGAITRMPLGCLQYVQCIVILVLCSEFKQCFCFREQWQLQQAVGASLRSLDRDLDRRAVRDGQFQGGPRRLRRQQGHLSVGKVMVT